MDSKPLKYYKEFVELISVKRNFEERVQFINLLNKEIHKKIIKLHEVKDKSFSVEEFIPDNIIKKVCKQFNEKFIEEEADFLIILSKEFNNK